MESLVLAIPLIPVFAAMVIGFCSKKECVPKVSLALAALVVILGLYGTYFVITQDRAISSFGGLLIYNELSAVLVPYVAILGMVIRKYAYKYMWDEPGYKRFYVLLNFIFTSIYLFVMSNNLVVMAIAWQLMSIVLYLLISFNAGSKTAAKNARWTMYIHKGADLVFLFAVALVYKEFGSFDLANLSETWLSLSNKSESTTIAFTCAFLFLVAAMMKSAIVPFHIWLPYTSEAPTPVSALMHAGVVNVGGIMLNKLAYLLILSPLVLNLAFIFGLFTAIFASILMLAVPDIKRSLGYSTVGQMGYMIMEVGLGAFSLAIYHLIVHGIFKATLFLESGGIIHYARHDPNIPKRVSYKLFWEEHTESQTSNTFYLIALFTVMPVLIFIVVKMLLSEEFFEFNASIVILAFGWLTGTQLFLSFFKVSKSDSLKVIVALMTTFMIVLFTYEFIGLALEHFIYGEHAMLFYKAATLNITMLMSITLLIAIVAFGWLYIYRQHFTQVSFQEDSSSNSKWAFYRFVANEGYFFTLLNRLKRRGRWFKV